MLHCLGSWHGADKILSPAFRYGSVAANSYGAAQCNISRQVKQPHGFPASIDLMAELSLNKKNPTLYFR